MMTGRVVALHILLSIPFRLADQPGISIEFVVDTGFTGDLTLPLDAVESLGLDYIESIPANLATDDEVDLITEELIVPTVTCFCDIPFEHLGTHLERYGLFGLSFDRNFLARHGARAVSYVPVHRDDRFSPYGHTLLRDIEQVYRAFRVQVFDRTNHSTTNSRSLGVEPAYAGRVSDGSLSCDGSQIVG